MKCIVSVLLAYICVFPVFSQNQITIYGSIYNAQSKETLPAANLYNVNTQKGTISNAFGDYAIKAEKGVVNIDVSYMGYQTQRLLLNVQNDTLLNIGLILVGIELKEATVTAKREVISNGTATRLLKLPVSSIVFAPSFAGENNLVTTLKTLPGVSAAKEGGSELYVRGGRYDQNLIT